MSIHSTGLGEQPLSGGDGLLAAKWDGHTTFTVDDLAEIFQTSPWATREAIRRKEIQTFRIGKLLRASRATVLAKLAERAA